MPEPISVDIRSAGDATRVVAIKGDLTAACEDALMGAYDEATSDTTRSVLLDLTGVEYLNSGGIGVLVTLLVRANRSQQRVIAYGLSEHYRHLFRLTRLDEAMDIYDDEQQALAAAGD